MSWGIAETAQEIEKIQAESADYLNGLNSCGIIDYSVYSTAFDYYAELIDKAYSLGKSESKQQWIPCSERLPEKNCRCLTTNTALGAFEVDWNVWINGEWLYQNEKPIAWMPFPEPYKGEES